MTITTNPIEATEPTDPTEGELDAAILAALPANGDAVISGDEASLTGGATDSRAHSMSFSDFRCARASRRTELACCGSPSSVRRWHSLTVTSSQVAHSRTAAYGSAPSSTRSATHSSTRSASSNGPRVQSE